MLLRALFARPGGGHLDAPQLHGFTLEMRAKMVALGVRFHYETRAEWEARMQLARAAGTNCQRPGRPCEDAVRAQCIADKVYRDVLVTFSALSAEQIQAIMGDYYLIELQILTLV